MSTQLFDKLAPSLIIRVGLCHQMLWGKKKQNKTAADLLRSCSSNHFYSFGGTSFSLIIGVMIYDLKATYISLTTTFPAKQILLSTFYSCKRRGSERSSNLGSREYKYRPWVLNLSLFPKPVFSATVLKCGFYYYSGMMRPADLEMIATERIVCYSQFSRRGARLNHAGPNGKH